jgi:hypothetical protein
VAATTQGQQIPAVSSTLTENINLSEVSALLR